jgi:phosphoribosylformimino-5-aminoimidazole carboxamide ribotide isomerase
MAILPVLDLLGGHVVRGVGGRRHEYRPIVSKLVDSSDPLLVAEAMRERFGFNEFYVADLDAIQGQKPQLEVMRKLHANGFDLWVDAGVTSVRGVALAILPTTPGPRVIVGLESIEGPDALIAILRSHSIDQIVFSLDLKNGMPLGNATAWRTVDPWLIACRVVEMGVKSLIVLDLARVGEGTGIGTEAICERLKREFPQMQLTAGGGVRGIDDVLRLHSIGVDYVLVASALHDGRITPEDVAHYVEVKSLS